MRSERVINLRLAKLPVFSFILLLVGTITAVIAAVFVVSPEAPYEAKAAMPVVAFTTLFFGVLAAKYHQPQELRGLRLGVGIYVFFTVMMVGIGAVMYLAPPDDDVRVGATSQTETIIADAQPEDGTTFTEPANNDTGQWTRPST